MPLLPPFSVSVWSLFERWVLPFIGNLKKIGVQASFRVLDPAQYQNRMNEFDYDMTVMSFGQSSSPGNEQRDYWGSSKADIVGSRNYIGIKNPVIDELIEQLIVAKDREELVHYTRALDRVLLWNFYLMLPNKNDNPHNPPPASPNDTYRLWFLYLLAL